MRFFQRRAVRRVLAFSGVLASALMLAVYLSTAGCASFGAAATGPRLERMRKSPRYADGRFQNAEPTELMGGRRAWRVMGEFIFGNDALRVPNCALPIVPDVKRRLAKPPESGLRITWLGHSTTLIEIDDRRVLTDPMWSERASPSQLVGPRRFHPPPLALEDLPPIDAVVISHDHYDHLDMATVQALSRRGVSFHVGLGVGAHLEAWGVAPEKITEHDWWESQAIGDGVELVSTPSRHFSGRGLTNRNSTLWTSWAIIGPRHRVYFSGDTGLTSAFRTIGERLGPFDVAMFEIGQWHPAWGSIHLGPHGALDAHQAIGARYLLPIHWATFELGLHAWSEPAETLVAEALKRKVNVLTPLLGEPVEPPPASSTARIAGVAWWRTFPPSTDTCPAGTAQRRRSLDSWPL